MTGQEANARFEGGRRVHPGHGHESFDFYTALGEFRASIGPQVALLAVHHEIDVESKLAKVLPVEDVDPEKPKHRVKGKTAEGS